MKGSVNQSQLARIFPPYYMYHTQKVIIPSNNFLFTHPLSFQH